MSSTIYICFEDENKPTNFPSYETIIQQSFALRPGQVTAINTSGVRLTLGKRSDTEVSDIWVKFGSDIAMGEAMTQRFVAQHLESNKITASPSPTPGRIGGGLIEHPFFVYRTSSVWYNSVEELQAHINGILSATERSECVDFEPEFESQSLPLCVSDLVLANFMKDSDGRIVAVDFGGYSFLPHSFAFALQHGGPPRLKHHLARILEYAPSSTVSAMASASCALAPYSTNNVGLPKRL